MRSIRSMAAATTSSSSSRCCRPARSRSAQVQAAVGAGRPSISPRRLASSRRPARSTSWCRTAPDLGKTPYAAPFGPAAQKGLHLICPVCSTRRSTRPIGQSAHAGHPVQLVQVDERNHRERRRPMASSTSTHAACTVRRLQVHAVHAGRAERESRRTCSQTKSIRTTGVHQLSGTGDRVDDRGSATSGGTG